MSMPGYRDNAGVNVVVNVRESGWRWLCLHEHFSHHAGQIIYLTKLMRGEDLKFTICRLKTGTVILSQVFKRK